MNRLISFLVLLLFWVIWSGKFDLFHMSLGILSVLIVVIWTRPLQDSQSLFPSFSSLIKFELYSIWLLVQVVLANFEVLKLAFSPNLNENLDPCLIEHKSACKSDFSLFLAANSITLTPGTISIRSTKGTLLIHALTHTMIDGVKDIDTKVAEVFNGTYNDAKGGR